MNSKPKSLSRFTSFLFYIILIELVLGGGGRLISLGPVSLRMVLFALAVIITIIHIIRGNRVERQLLVLIAGYTVVLVVSAVIGLLHNADPKFVWEDVKPLLYFYLFPFFHFVITDEAQIIIITETIKKCSIFLAIGFLLIFVLLTLNIIPFLDFYHFTDSTQEFFYRGEITFYYKGFIYLCIGIVLFDLTNPKQKWVFISILSVAILLSSTRGLILALSLTYLIYWNIQKKYILSVASLMVALGMIFFSKDLYGYISKQLVTPNKSQVEVIQGPNEKLLGDREFSDNERLKQVKQVMDSITFQSAIVGHGFGRGVQVRPVHMEISYLEIFHKQGVIGLWLWLYILIILFQVYRSAFVVNPVYANSYFLSALFVFFQSLTNQYINNPIGMGMILLSLAVLYKIGEKSKIPHIR